MLICHRAMTYDQPATLLVVIIMQFPDGYFSLGYDFADWTKSENSPASYTFYILQLKFI